MNLHRFVVFFTCILPVAVNAEPLLLSDALNVARVACVGIADSLSDLKTKAGINTAVTAVGTVAGGVALGSGIAKANTDKKQQEIEAKLKKLIAEKSNIPIETLEIENEQEFRDAIRQVLVADDVKNDVQKIDELDQKSKKLGDIRTGTLAASTVTNVAGTAIAATNKVDEDIEVKINKCISAVKDLSNAKLAAKVENVASDTELTQAEKIINACRDYEFVDVKSINKRASGAAVASGLGIGTGVVGIITSGMANTGSMRQVNNQTEKNLNTTANVMSGASTAASATATIFNATQISAIKKVVAVADMCEEALR